MRFLEFWRDRIRESFEQARGKAEVALFVLYIVGRIVVTRLSPSAVETITWDVVAGLFILLFVIEICFVSPYRHAQKEQRQHATELSAVEKNRDAALKQLSDLSGLHGHVLHVAYFEDVHDRVGIAVALRITSRGEPSIADKWGLIFELDGSKFGVGPSHFRDGKFAIPDNEGNTVTIRPEDMLFNKVGTTPIPRGGRASGFLVFLIKDITYDRLISGMIRSCLSFR
jgi:hypothetical protein